jgi:hypothetical protein
MKKVIANKNKNCIIETIITLCLIILLITICIINAIKNIHGISMEIVYIGFSIVLLYWVYKEIITLKMQIKLPNELITLETNQLHIYTDKKETINIEDIISIEKGVVIKKLLANEASLVIKTNNSTYKVIYIKDIDKVIESLDSIIKVGD